MNVLVVVDDMVFLLGSNDLITNVVDVVSAAIAAAWSAIVRTNTNVLTVLFTVDKTTSGDFVG